MLDRIGNSKDAAKLAVDPDEDGRRAVLAEMVGRRCQRYGVNGLLRQEAGVAEHDPSSFDDAQRAAPDRRVEIGDVGHRNSALLRRGSPRESVLRVADLEMDTIRRTVRRAGSPIDLKPKEYALLEFLMRHSDRPLTRSLIIEHVWNIHFDSISNVVEVHINSLRNKIDRGFPVQLIHTVRGVGYMLTDSAP